MRKNKITYPYPGYRREIEYKGERAYYNMDFGVWHTYNPNIPIQTADTLDKILDAIDKYKERT